jgi:hypothetical protein
LPTTKIGNQVLVDQYFNIKTTIHLSWQDKASLSGTQGLYCPAFTSLNIDTEYTGCYKILGISSNFGHLGVPADRGDQP